VWIHTNKQPIKDLPNYSKRGRVGIKDAYHLDHKYSIIEGFKNNIPPYLIGSINNLEMITWEENCSKKQNCSIELEELV
jgi:hypothetical protein